MKLQRATAHTFAEATSSPARKRACILCRPTPNGENLDTMNTDISSTPVPPKLAPPYSCRRASLNLNLHSHTAAPFPTFLGEIWAFQASSRQKKIYLAKSHSAINRELPGAMPPFHPLPQIEICEHVLPGSADRSIPLHQPGNHLSIQAFSSLFKEKPKAQVRICLLLFSPLRLIALNRGKSRLIADKKTKPTPTPLSHPLSRCLAAHHFPLFCFLLSTFRALRSTLFALCLQNPGCGAS
jgi:hypothetical protein